jgi:hypothetical protein
MRWFRPFSLRPAPRSLAEALARGEALGPAVMAWAPEAVASAVREAAGRFESGAVALFIVDVRDGLLRRLEHEQGTLTGLQREYFGAFVARLRDDDGQQRLINAVLEGAGLPLELSAFSPRLAGPVVGAVSRLVVQAARVTWPCGEASRDAGVGLAAPWPWPRAPGL